MATRKHRKKTTDQGGGTPAQSSVNVRHGLTCGNLPAGAGYVARLTNVFRQQLEKAVMDTHGQVSLTSAAAIQTAIRWERHALLAQKWLREHSREMEPAERLHFSREVARASSERDKGLRSLRLPDGERGDVFSLLYAPIEPSEPDTINEPSDIDNTQHERSGATDFESTTETETEKRLFRERKKRNDERNLH